MSKSKRSPAGIPLAGRPSLRLALVLLLPALALAACGGEDDPEATIPAAPSSNNDADLLGYWMLVEVNGSAPAAGQEVRYRLTAEGDFIRYEGDEVERARYTFAAPDQITVDGPSGLTFYDYALRGDELTLSQPGEGGDVLTLRKLADQALEDVPPEPTAVPEEDSVPADSM